MAVTKITCPECKTVLRPAKPIPAGKAVKCPECGNRFTASEDEPEAPARKPKKAAPGDEAVGERKPKRPADRKAGPKKPPDRKAAPDDKPAGVKKDDDEEGGTYGFVEAGAKEEEDKPDIEYAPDMSIKDLRGPAQLALVQPSNALIAVGGAGFLGWLALMIVHIIPVVFPIENDEGDKTKPPKPVIGLEHGLGTVAEATDPMDDPKPKGQTTLALLFMLDANAAPRLPPLIFFVYLFLMFLGMAYSGLLTYGAVKIQNLEGYGWGVASCILAIVSVFNLWGLASCTQQLGRFLLGMGLDDQVFIWRTMSGLMALEILAGTGVGVWCLMTLLSEKVKKGYEYVPD